MASSQAAPSSARSICSTASSRGTAEDLLSISSDEEDNPPPPTSAVRRTFNPVVDLTSSDDEEPSSLPAPSQAPLPPPPPPPPRRSGRVSRSRSRPSTTATPVTPTTTRSRDDTPFPLSTPAQPSSSAFKKRVLDDEEKTESSKKQKTDKDRAFMSSGWKVVVGSVICKTKKYVPGTKTGLKRIKICLYRTSKGQYKFTWLSKEGDEVDLPATPGMELTEDALIVSEAPEHSSLVWYMPFTTPYVDSSSVKDSDTDGLVCTDADRADALRGAVAALEAEVK